MIGRLKVALAVGLIILPVSADAIGLGPLRHKGITDGPRKGFWLNVWNSAQVAETYRFHPYLESEDAHNERVTVFPDTIRMAPGRQRRVLVVASGMKPGERFTFRVCAGRDPKETEVIYARVCSTLTAIRIQPDRHRRLDVGTADKA